MSVKGTSSTLEKKIQKTAIGLEELFKSLGDFVSNSLEELASTVVRSTGKKRLPVKATGKAKATTKKAKASSTGKKRGRRAGGGLKESLVEICQDAGGPITEEDIAKKLLASPDKYKWNKNESTLYQTLRRAVKENLISDSGRDKKTKTYQVA
jgi:hypothetical protein